MYNIKRIKTEYKLLYINFVFFGRKEKNVACQALIHIPAV